MLGCAAHQRTTRPKVPRRFLPAVLGILVATATSGCNSQRLLQTFSTPQDQATAKAYLSQLQARQFEDIEKATDSTLQGPTLHATLERMANVIPAGSPTSVTLVGAQRNLFKGETTINTTFEYQYGTIWLLENVAIREQGGAKTIVGINVTPETVSVVERNAFSLAGKTWVQYLVLAAAVAAFSVSVVALVLCIRTRLRGRKWPWILFILIGWGKLGVNWTTGACGVQLLAIQILGASAQAPVYGPWVLSASLPLGALWFLVRRHSLATIPPAEPGPQA